MYVPPKKEEQLKPFNNHLPIAHRIKKLKQTLILKHEVQSNGGDFTDLRDIYLAFNLQSTFKKKTHKYYDLLCQTKFLN